MMKTEFENILGKEIEFDNYVKIEQVYMYYPGINNHEDIVALYRIGGMLLINDMYRRAEKIGTLEAQKQDINIALNSLKTVQ